jgi:hypothetical protein
MWNIVWHGLGTAAGLYMFAVSLANIDKIPSWLVRAMFLGVTLGAFWRLLEAVHDNVQKMS